eukprot:1399756-Amphidinium_carterae.1
MAGWVTTWVRHMVHRHSVVLIGTGVSQLALDFGVMRNELTAISSTLTLCERFSRRLTKHSEVHQ